MARNTPVLFVQVRGITSGPFLLVLLLLAHAAVEAEVLRAGLWGGNGGSSWDMPTAKRLLDINIRHGAAIDAITVLYERDQRIEWTPRHGGGGGDPSEITFQTGEYITSISGHYNDVVRSLTFVTNLGTYGPYGSETGTPFSLQSEHGKIVGFFGQSGAKLDAIGVYFEVTFQEGEFLTSISGYYGPFRDMPNIIRSLTFVTKTNRTYGPYGEQQGTSFSIPLATDKFLGFFGRSGNLLDATGVYLGPS